PALLLLGVDPRVAVASSLISQLVVVPLGGVSHASLGHVRAGVVAPLLGAGVAGTFLGAQFSVSVDEPLLALLIAGSTIVMGILVLARSSLERDAGAHPERTVRTTAIVGIGLVAGFAAAAFGTGWGPVGVSLLLLAGLLPKVAVGSSVIARGPLALSATLAYVAIAGPQEVVEVDVLLPIVAGGVVGILAGSLVTRRLADRWLRPAVGLAIVALGFLVFLKG
ncbi:MAG: sulfite exporter TauE/SafE family protein, partial [Methanobacteriota archaeon]